MKTFYIIVFSLLFLVTQKLYSEDIKVENYSSFEVGELLTGKLSQGWKCIFDKSTVINLYDKKVDKLNLINLPESPSNVLAQKIGIKGDCFIVLSFIARYSSDEYGELLRIRNAALQKINFNQKSEQYYQRKAQVEKKFLLPKYFNDNYSVYFKQSIAVHEKIYPEQVEKQLKDITAEIEKILKKYDDTGDNN